MVITSRFVIDGKTIVFMKENDPSLIRSDSPGKLIQFFPEEGSMVSEGDIVAEIEVMKMVTTLCSSATGVISFVKRPGAVLQCGDVIATLELEGDAEREQVISNYSKTPTSGHPSTMVIIFQSH